MKQMNDSHPYKIASRGSFKGIRHWHEFDAFWTNLEQLNDAQWYIYDTNKEPPDTTASAAIFSDFLAMTNHLLHEKHQEEYCGIVYVDNMEQPAFIKIYDPSNLGVVCGFSDNPPLPGWILSRMAPCDLHQPEPESFWKKCLHRFS